MFVVWVVTSLMVLVHLIPSQIDYSTVDIAELVFKEIYKHHSIPQNIVSNYDVLFTLRFWQELHKLIGAQLRMSSAPQIDGATEQLIGPLCR